MEDLIYLLLAAGFFAGSWALVRFCERLEGGRP
jgi:hypothetical protein